MKDVTRLVIADSEGGTCDAICTLLTGCEDYQVVGRAANADECLNMAFIQRPDVVVLDWALKPRSALEVCEQLAVQCNGSVGCVVMLSKQPDEKLYRSLMNAGVGDFLIPPLTTHRMFEALETALKRKVAGHLQAAGAAQRNKLVTVTSPRRASGQTVVSVNLSCAMASCECVGASQGASVVLADLNVRTSDASLMLDVYPPHSLANVAQCGGSIDDELLNTLLEKHACGVELLMSGAIEVYDRQELSRAVVLSTLSLLRRRFAFTVVDTAAPGSMPTELAFSLSDSIVVVVASDKIHVNAGLSYLNHLKEEGVDMKKVRILLNDVRPNSKNLNTEQVEALLGMSVVARLPYDPYAVSEAVNMGQPFVLMDPSRPISRTMQSLAVQLSGGGLRMKRQSHSLIQQLAANFLG